MFGMDFTSFLILLIISAAASAGLHFGLKFYVIPGLMSYFSKVAFGWIGAWLGSPILGHWGPAQGEVYYIPAILGSLAVLVVVVDVIKTIQSRGGGGI